jgi:two-component system response regulator PhoP
MTIFYLNTNSEKLNSRIIGLSALGLNLLGFSDNMTLFKRLLQEPITLIIIDLEYSTKDTTSIERYLAINPELIIFILMTPDADTNKQISFLAVGCNRILDNDISHALLVANITAALRGKSVQLPFNLSSKDLVSWQLNPLSCILITPDLQVIQLTTNENKLIHMLASKNGETINKHYIAEKILGKYNQNGSRRMNLMMGRLRKKVLRVSKFELPIKTVHSIGYALSGIVIIEGNHFKEGQLDSLS